MKFTVKDHILYQGDEPVEQRPSPNHGGKIDVKLIVIHYDGTNGTGGLTWLTQKQSGVSAHFWISKEGEVIQLLPCDVAGWHAGKSEYMGRQCCNNFSVGIENQGIGDHFPDEQMEADRAVIEALCEAYDILDVLGHEDVAIPKGRKVDPGPNFPWDKVTS
jgi:N-acetyl-anhydromuramyl-L-alanine amidase AmpD